MQRGTIIKQATKPFPLFRIAKLFYKIISILITETERLLQKKKECEWTLNLHKICAEPDISIFSCFVADPSKQLLSTLLSSLVALNWRLRCPCLSSCQTLWNTHQQLAQPRRPSTGAPNDDLLAQKTHKDMITVRCFFSVSLCLSAGRFTAASSSTTAENC